MRATRPWLVWAALCAAVAGCGGSGDERPEVTLAEQPPVTIETPAQQLSAESEPSETASTTVTSLPLPATQRQEIRRRAAPLDLAWLDERQRPPSRFDLEAAVDLVRPVPERIRAAVTSVCSG